MKVNLINLILQHAGERPFEGLVENDNGVLLSAPDSLHTLIMEYAKVANGGQSDLVVPSRQVQVSRVP